jgi:hypothetical protein
VQKQVSKDYSQWIKHASITMDNMWSLQRIFTILPQLNAYDSLCCLFIKSNFLLTRLLGSIYDLSLLFVFLTLNNGMCLILVISRESNAVSKTNSN